MTVIKEGAKLGDQQFTLETGKVAKQANGSVIVEYGDCQVLCTGTDGGPDGWLMADYIENRAAAGQIPGGFFKREGKPSGKATKTSRLIDRPIRPLLPDGYNRDTQVVAWVLSADQVYDTDVLSITGCSAALHISDVPFDGPVAGVRVGYVDGEFIANPTFEQRDESEMDIVLAASEDDVAMVEGKANEISEELMLDALDFGKEAVQDLIQVQHKLREMVGKEKMEVPDNSLDPDIEGAVSEFVEGELGDALTIADKEERSDAISALENDLEDELEDQFPDADDEISRAFDKIKKKTMRQNLVNEGQRIDGRDFDEVRPVDCEVGMLSEPHGSALFTRGETQAMVMTTLGTGRDYQRIDGLEGEFEKDFYLHYNFPPFCVGETWPFRSPKRREVGHGFLAERALKPILPDLEEEFPYIIRLVSDIMESNGSSSMASVCGGSLAMMDTGVPISRPAAGIAMGLVKEDDDIAILSDILGDEDHMGDMDFKVAGTREGITAFQLDTKIGGIDRETMDKALEQAREGRFEILDIMEDTLSEPRQGLSDSAPRILTVDIEPSQIGAVIGSGGETIRGIEETTGADVNIDDDGTVKITSSDEEAAQQAVEIVEGLTAKPEAGKVYLGEVKATKNFGAFIEILPGKEGLCHISELTEGRVDSVEDVLKAGDECLVKVLNYEASSGKIKLSRKEALGEEQDYDYIT